MPKTLCKTKDKEKLARKQSDPKYQCAKCHGKASKEKYLCKPEKIK